MHAEVNQDTDVESWYFAFTFLVLFLVSFIYGVSATMIKVRNNSTGMLFLWVIFQ